MIATKRPTNGGKRVQASNESCQVPNGVSYIFLYMQILPDKCVRTSFDRHLIMSYCIALCRSMVLWVCLSDLFDSSPQWMCNTCKLVPLFEYSIYIWTAISIEISLIIGFGARFFFFSTLFLSVCVWWAIFIAIAIALLYHMYDMFGHLIYRSRTNSMHKLQIEYLIWSHKTWPHTNFTIDFM